MQSKSERLVVIYPKGTVGNGLINYHALIDYTEPIKKARNELVNYTTQQMQQAAYITLGVMWKYHVTSRQKCLGQVVWLNIAKVDKYWKKSDAYIGSYDEIPYDSGKIKYLESRIDLVKNEITIPPIIWVENGVVEFTNGRNRFANMRELGVTAMPFLIKKSSLNHFYKLP